LLIATRSTPLKPHPLFGESPPQIEINLARIRDRVLAGGHNVPEADVQRRYARSFRNLPIVTERADHTILFDNSNEEGYRLVAVLGSTENQWFEPTPAWVATIQQ